MLIYRNCLLKHVIERKGKGTRRRGRILKKLLEFETGSTE
jgi:hypothetical protein